MIYLIGGPPRCGKTTLAKTFSKQARIPWISTDTLEVIAGEYITQEEWDLTHPYSIAHTSNNAFYEEFSTKEIIALIKAQSLATLPAVRMMTLCSLKDEVDYIIEGYHVTPKFAAQMIKKYGADNVTAVFLVKTNPEQFAAAVIKNPVVNDWLVNKQTSAATIAKVGTMVAEYSEMIIKEASEFGLPVFAMDAKFANRIRQITKSLLV